MTPSLWEIAARAFESSTDQWATPGDLAAHIDPRTKRTPALDLIDQALVGLLDTPDGRLIITMPPQEGKSTRVARDFVLWALCRNPDTRVVIGSYAQGLANRNGRVVRNAIVANPDLGLAIAPDHGAVSEWSLDGHRGGVLAVGRGAGVTGRPAEIIVIDDPLKDRAEADSEIIRATCWDWWIESLSTRLAPGAPVVLILTRWHQEDLAGRLLAAEDGHLWRVINIPAEAESDDDLLGRQPGEYMISARGRTAAQWEAIRTRVGARTWAALYQGRPSPAEGDLLKRDSWARYDRPQWIERPDGTRIVPDLASHPDSEIVQSWDLAFKDSKTSDYVVGQVWLRRGVDAYLLDQTRGRLSFTETCMAIRGLTARWPQATAKLVEDKANGPAVLNALRSTVGGLIPVEPEGSKYARAAAISPLVEAANVHLPTPELAPWVEGLIEEAAGFPNAAHDDQVDALTQAVHRLLLVPILSGRTLGASDLLGDTDDDALDWATSY